MPLASRKYIFLLRYVRQILFLDSIPYFLIDYIVKLQKIAIIPFKLCFSALNYEIQN